MLAEERSLGEIVDREGDRAIDVDRVVRRHPSLAAEDEEEVLAEVSFLEDEGILRDLPELGVLAERVADRDFDRPFRAGTRFVRPLEEVLEEREPLEEPELLHGR